METFEWQLEKLVLSRQAAWDERDVLERGAGQIGVETALLGRGWCSGQLPSTQRGRLSFFFF